MTDIPIPSRGPGHCDDDAAWAEFVRQYHGRPRSRPDMTDFALANAVFLKDRNDLDLIVYQTAAKERIRWLSIRLAQTLEALEQAEDRCRDRLIDFANKATPTLAVLTDDQGRQLGEALGRVLVKAGMIRADVDMTGPELLLAAETFCGGPEEVLEEAPIPEAPWPSGAADGNNAKREGWKAFFAGRARGDCPFPPARTDLWRDFQAGWDAALVNGR